MMRTHERNASSPPPQVVRKRKREEEKQEVGQEVTKPEKKRLVESAALVSDLHQQPSTPAGKRIASRRKIEAAQTAELRKLKPYLERRYFVNAAVLPECRPRPPGFAAPKTSSAGETLPDQPVTIHTLSVPEYQSLYHSVVDPKLVTSTGKPHPYCMALGRLIKQHLWDKLRCPSVMEEEQVQDSGRVHYAEKFSAPSLTNFAPHVHVDISGEPRP
ncbi:hypothetical protein QTP86_007065 [Hemibagrus guttatus]|nr:hypothetical protein QTP86_007065 [Hemibagrus guttatus]